MNAPPQALGELLNSRQKLVLLFSIAVCAFTTSLSNTVTITATPKLLADLSGFSLLPWVLTSYILAATVAIPLVGRPSDMFGRKPFILAGLMIFLVGSIICGAAPSMTALIAGRTIQGIGGGIITTCAFASVGELYTPIERTKYISYVHIVLTVAMLTGPTIGGFITDTVGWRWVFYMNVPVALLAAGTLAVNMPHTSKGGRVSSIDFAGGALLAVGTVSLMLALVWGVDEFGWTSAPTLALFALAAIVAFMFVKQESRHPAALIPPHLFRNVQFTYANLIIIVSTIALVGSIAYIPLFLQTSLGASATLSGLVTTPHAVAFLVASLIGGQVVARTGRYKAQVIVGCVCTLVSVVLMMLIRQGDPTWYVSILVIGFGLGNGFVSPIMSVIVLNALPLSFVGVATSARQYTREIAQTMGTAVFGLVFTAVYLSSFAASTSGEVEAALPPAVYERFEDATITLNEDRFAETRAEVLALPNGAQLLAQTLDAQEKAGFAAIHRVFLVSTLLSVVLVLLAVGMRELPLRRTFDEEKSVLEPEAAPAAASAPRPSSPAPHPVVPDEA